MAPLRQTHWWLCGISAARFIVFQRSFQRLSAMSTMAVRRHLQQNSKWFFLRLFRHTQMQSSEGVLRQFQAFSVASSCTGTGIPRLHATDLTVEILSDSTFSKRSKVL